MNWKGGLGDGVQKVERHCEKGKVNPSKKVGWKHVRSKSVFNHDMYESSLFYFIPFSPKITCWIFSSIINACNVELQRFLAKLKGKYGKNMNDRFPFRILMS